jgi:hypothetical protein
MLKVSDQTNDVFRSKNSSRGIEYKIIKIQSFIKGVIARKKFKVLKSHKGKAQRVSTFEDMVKFILF